MYMPVLTRLFFLSALIITGAAWVPLRAQSYDVVYYTGGEAVHCDLIEVTDYTVRYRLHDLPDGEIYNELRDDIALIFKRNGDFLLPNEAGVQWKSGASPDYDNIVTEDSQVLAAHDVEEHEDIIYYHDALDSADGSVRTDEIVAIIYQDGSHRLFSDIEQVAYSLGGSLAFAVSADSEDGVASTEPMAAPLPDDSPTEADDERGRVPMEEELMAVEEAVEEPVDEEVAAGEEVAEEEEVAVAEETAVDDYQEEVPTDEALSLASPESTDTETTDAIEEEPEEEEPAPTPPSDATANERAALQEELELSETDYEEFAAKAVNKAEYLNNYLSLLCNHTLDLYDKEQARESALKLFVHDSTVVQVSSINQEELETYTIDAYLEHLTLFDYDKVELLWRNVQYVTKFRLAPDGNYYGTITVEQVFRGLKDGRPIYEDITQKDIEIVLGNFIKEESGVTEYAWDVFLSDIGVEETRRL